jgi:hypothetical protein
VGNRDENNVFNMLKVRNENDIMDQLMASKIVDRDIAESFDIIFTQIIGLYDEISKLSNKYHDKSVSEIKLKVVNQYLGEANKILKPPYKPVDDLTVLSEDCVPTYSDVVVLLRLCIRSLNNFQYDHTVNLSGPLYWNVGGEVGRNTRTFTKEKPLEL